MFVSSEGQGLGYLPWQSVLALAFLSEFGVQSNFSFQGIEMTANPLLRLKWTKGVFWHVHIPTCKENFYTESSVKQLWHLTQLTFYFTLALTVTAGSIFYF